MSRSYRRQDSSADKFVTFWHWPLAKCAGAGAVRPKLEPLMERPSQARSHYTGLDITCSHVEQEVQNSTLDALLHITSVLEVDLEKIIAKARKSAVKRE